MPATEPVQRLYGVHPFVPFSPGGLTPRIASAVYSAPSSAAPVAGLHNLDLTAYRRAPVRSWSGPARNRSGASACPRSRFAART